MRVYNEYLKGQPSDDAPAANGTENSAPATEDAAEDKA